MTELELHRVVKAAVYRGMAVMARKSREYSPGEDRLANFKAAAGFLGVSPEQALFGMLAKHLVSLAQMCRAVTESGESPREVWREKLTDAHNYLFLLEGMMEERYGWERPANRGGKVV